MDRPPPQRVQILIERLFDMNQRTLARTIAPVFQRGDHDGVVVRRHHYPTLLLKVTPLKPLTGPSSGRVTE